MKRKRAGLMIPDRPRVEPVDVGGGVADPAPAAGPALGGNPMFRGWVEEMIRIQTQVLANNRAAEERERRARERRDARDKTQREEQREARSRQRETQALDRKRKEQRLQNMAAYSEGQDLEEFLWLVEDAMEACQLPDEEWILMVASKLSGPKASMLREIRGGGRWLPGS